MTEDAEEDMRAAAAGDAMAARIAMDCTTSAASEDYLRKHSHLLSLQIENLQKQDEFELSHLRWRRFNDQMKGALQIMLVAAGLLVVIGIGAAMWNASQADGLAIDAFSVPPVFAANGVSGDVVADDMTHKIAAIRDFANEHSLARSKDVRQEGTQDIKVEIPETGISLAQAWRYLRAWLGHERQLTGNLRVIGNGRIALTVALDGDTAFTLDGPSDALNALEERAGENIFSSVDPTNYVLYLSGKGRMAEGLEAAARLPRLQYGTPYYGDAYSLWGNMTLNVSGDALLAIKRARISIGIDPKATAGHMEVLSASRALGHDEEMLRQAILIGGLHPGNDPAWAHSDGALYVIQLGAFTRDAETGDYQAALARPCIYECSLAGQSASDAEYAALLHDRAQAQMLLDRAAAGGQVSPEQATRSHYYADIVIGDWRAAAADARGYDAALKADYDSPRLYALRSRTQAAPLLAYALARGGDFATAQSAIETSPRDCYDCLRVRGVIDALQGRWDESAAWFADAVWQGPSLPFAYTTWGAMLMAKGDRDGAIAKFTLAHQKGPHFADPLEMWGEALIAKNRSDLALAKFAEAAKYAPNWGRLHLKWAEALFYAGEQDESRKQRAIASGLDLSQGEKSELGRLNKLHG